MLYVYGKNVWKCKRTVCIYIYIRYIHWSKQLKGQPVLVLSSFVHNSSINEHRNMKLRENTCYERINWNWYCWGFGNYLQMNTVEFFLKNIYWEKGKWFFLMKGNKLKGGNKEALQSGRDRYSAKNYITTWTFPLISFFLNVINGLFSKFV